MVISLGANISSLGAQRSLSKASGDVSTSFERLASGLRINRASDDAAGLSIADRLRTDSRLYSTALRNINDGLSAMNIVDSALGDQSNMIVRLKELAVQAASGTLSDTQRTSLNKEYQSLIKEFGRIGDTTSFNKMNLLKGGFGTNPSQMNLQAGIDGSRNSQINLNLSNQGSFSGIVDVSNTAWFDDLGGGSTMSQLAYAFKGQFATATIADSQGRYHDVLIGLAMTEDVSNEIKATVFVRASETATYASQGPDAWVASGGVNFLVDGNSGALTDGVGWTSLSGLQGGATATVNLDLRGIRVGGKNLSNLAAPNLGDTTAIDFTNVLTSQNALTALSILGTRDNEISQYRGVVGATQSRLRTALQVLAISKENSQAAESRIRDVDVGAESSTLVAAQIRQQIAASILGQANLLPQLALTLLR